MGIAAWGSTAPSYRHDIWNVSGGFLGGYVYSITQTADGYIWIGSSKGLIRYDGTAFVPVRVSDSNPEAKLPVWGLLTDLDDQLWVIDDHTHVFRYSSDHLVGPLPDNGKHRFRLSPLLTRTQDGQLLFGSEVQGLIEYKRDASRVLLAPAAMPSLPTAVAETADGTFWIGTEAMGIFRVRLRQGVPEIQHVAALINAKINCLLPVGASTLLIGTSKGLLTLHDGAVIQQVRPELRDQEIVALANRMRGDIWIGAENQVFKANAADIGRDGQIHSLDHLDVNGPVTALFEDREGDLWIGGPERVERYRDSGFISYLSSAGLPCVNCGAIYVDRHDRLWFAPWDGGLFRLSEGSIQRIEVAGLKNDTVYSIVGGADDEIWLGRKYGGVTRLNLGPDSLEAHSYTQREGLSQDSVSSIYRAPDGAIWAGTVSGGLNRLTGGKWQTFTTRDGLPSNRITAITGNSAGEIFVGTPKGLAVLKHNHWVQYAAHDGLPPGTIDNLFVDNSGTLWIGTTKGIAFLESTKVHVPLGAPKALYGEVLGINENGGWLWITTRDHVLRVKRTALFKQSFGERDYREFGVAEGLPSSEGVRRSYSVVKDNRGQIWFSLNQGIALLRPATFDTPTFPITVRFDDILVDGRPLDPHHGQAQPHVPPGQHRLTIRYAGVCISNPAGVRYRYRLEGVDPAWSEPTSAREIDYTNIAPGHLRFEVMARNPDSIWNSEKSTLSFVVEPAYWQTNWFRVLCAAAFLALLWAAYRMRVLQLQEQEKKFREAVEAMPAIAFISLPDGSRTFVNKRWIEFTGLTAEQAAASGPQAATHPEDLNRVVAKWQASLATGEPLEYESRLRRGVDGEYRWFLTQAVPVRDQRGKIVKWCGTSVDIEDRKRAEELQTELAHISRVATMGELTASLAHEIKQPIGAAVTNAEACLRLLNQSQSDAADVREAALDMVKDARRASDIIDRVRLLYQKGSSELEFVDVNEVITEILVLLRYEANRHSVRTRTDFAEGLPQVLADRVQLQQVLVNLMINGIEAMMDNGGELTIKSQLAENGQLQISVIDNGIGLPAGKADQIFNAFFTTKPQGTGLGLSITRSILESHGGRVWATANSGRGATFHVTLPIRAAASA